MKTIQIEIDAEGEYCTGANHECELFRADYSGIAAEYYCVKWSELTVGEHGILRCPACLAAEVTDAKDFLSEVLTPAGQRWYDSLRSRGYLALGAEINQLQKENAELQKRLRVEGGQ
jgi:hypothetical protein